MILFFTYFIAALIVGLYIWWFAVRYRRDQRKKAAEMPPRSTPAPAGRSAAPVVTTPLAAPAAAAAVFTPTGPEPQTVAGALSGIALPNGLVPLTSVAPRVGVGDRVVFWTKDRVDAVGPAFADELERLGYTVSPLDAHSLAAKRDDDHLVVFIHPDARAATIDGRPAFESAPDEAVVIEVYIPF
jgi:hypothetical protein